MNSQTSMRPENAETPESIARGPEVPDPQEVLVQAGKWIHRTAWRLHSRMPWTDVEDLIQQGVMTALELRETYRPERGVPFAIYIKPRVMGAMVDISRRAGAMQRHETAYRLDAGTAPESEDDSLELIIQGQDSTRLARAIDTLPYDQRTVIALFYLEELRNKEVAQVMAISEVKALRLRARALASLAAAMQAPPTDDPPDDPPNTQATEDETEGYRT